MTPRVSVCIPTYNGAAYLTETLASAVSQTLDDFEVVVVDDLSTDDSFDIAQRFARSDSRVRVFRNTERAGSGAANAKRYLELARGEWIKPLNQDDVMAPTCLARMVAAGTRGPLVICWHEFKLEADFIAADIEPALRAWYESPRPLATELPGEFADADAVSAAMLRQPRTNFIGPTSASLIHRDCFAKYGSFDPAFWFFPDLDYWTRVGTRVGLAIATEPLVTFRVHNASISGGIRRDPRRKFRVALQWLRRALRLARSPELENLRRVAAMASPVVDLEQQLQAAAVELRWSAIDDRFRRRDPWPLTQWEAFVAANPEMRDVLRQIDGSLPLSTRVRQFIKRRV